MPPYDDRLFAPPAPVLNARLRNPQSGTIIPDVPLLIDTGADVTLLPLGAVSAAGIEQTGASYELLAFDGRSSPVGAVHAELLTFAAPFAVSFS
jgi:predicted aspartyl protease